MDLLRVAAELCERGGCSAVEEKFINKAQEKLDKDRIIEIIKAQPKQSKLVILSMLSLYKEDKKAVQTGDVYNLYEKFALLELRNQYALSNDLVMK